eukprot:scpid97583/ scgid24976/ 
MTVVVTSTKFHDNKTQECVVWVCLEPRNSWIALLKLMQMSVWQWCGVVRTTELQLCSRTPACMQYMASTIQSMNSTVAATHPGCTRSCVGVRSLLVGKRLHDRGNCFHKSSSIPVAL